MRKACKFADIPPNINGTKVLRSDKAYRCLYPLPTIEELPPLPASVIDAYGFKWPPHKGYAFKDTCELCACWEADK